MTTGPGMRHGSRSAHARHGFTMVEILMAVAVGGMLMVAIYQLFSRTMQSTDIAQFKHSTQTQLRGGMKRLFNDLAAATYPSVITPSKVTWKRDDAYKLKYAKGKIDPRNSTQELLSFYVCKPEKAKFPEGNTPEHRIKVTLSSEAIPVPAGGKGELKRARIVYRRSLEAGDPARTGVKDNDTVYLVDDAVAFQAEAQVFKDESTSDESNKEKISFTISVESAHPRYNVQVTESQTVTLQVGVIGLDKKEI